MVTAPVLLEVGDGCLEAPSIFILLGNLNDFIDMQKPENYIIYQSDAPGEVFTALLSKLNLESRILEAELAISRALFDCTSIKDLLMLLLVSLEILFYYKILQQDYWYIRQMK